MLPLAMIAGVSLFFLFHSAGPFKAGESGYFAFARNAQPALVGLMLFLQFNVVAPSDMHLHKWHFELLGMQALLFLAFAFMSTGVQEGGGKILLESAMLCFICPTAAAAGVITSKIGGSLSGIITYTFFSDTLAALLIPLMVPIVHPAADIPYFNGFIMVVGRVFSIILLPCLLAWLIRYTLPPLQKWLARYRNLSFYIWGIALMLSISLATKALMGSGIGVLTAVLIGMVSLACCPFQFWAGRKIARGYGHSESITAGQAFGQKNTGFIIWLGFTFLTPVTSVAGGLYAIWHNLVNTWELKRVDDRKQYALKNDTAI